VYPTRMHLRAWNLYHAVINLVDLQIGQQSEPLIKGFGISETAFFIFILMEYRRLKSDRFLTDDYRPQIYTPEGIRWIEENSMVDVLRRIVLTHSHPTHVKWSAVLKRASGAREFATFEEQDIIEGRRPSKHSPAGMEHRYTARTAWGI